MAQQNNNETKVTTAEELVGTTLMVPEPLWKRLRNLATERRVSQQSIWLVAMTEYLDRQHEHADAA